MLALKNIDSTLSDSLKKHEMFLSIAQSLVFCKYCSSDTCRVWKKSTIERVYIHKIVFIMKNT